MRALFIIVMVGLGAGVVIQTSRYSRLKPHNRALEQQVAELQAAMSVAAKVDVSAPVKPLEEQTELLRLRNQAAQLRSASNELREARKQMDHLQAENREL